jgi:hypothetical protein
MADGLWIGSSHGDPEPALQRVKPRLRRLERCNEENVSFTDQKMWEGIDKGNEDMLRHLGTPEWVLSLVFKARDLVVWLRRFTRRIAGASV